MKKVMYLSFNDPASSPGVSRKEREFCEFFRQAGKDAGVDARGLCIVTSGEPEPQRHTVGESYEIRKVPSRAYRTISRIPMACSLFRIRPTYSEAYREIALYRPDAIIWRFSVTSVPWVFNPKKASPRVVFVTEHQSKEIEELCATGLGRVVSPLIRMLRDRVFRHIDAVVGVTPEITRYEVDVAGRPLPSFTMANGIDVRAYPLRTPPPPGAGTFRLLYVGSHTASWQGLDRVLAGMKARGADRNTELHIAGTVTPDIRRLLDELRLGDRVTMHGYVAGDRLDRLFDMCDVAVGSLGIHRKGLTEASTLKVREYMARGIPFVISHTDVDVAPGLPFVFHAPADDNPLDMAAVERFSRELRNMYGDTLGPSMRRYAEQRMDYRIKTRDLLHFIMSVKRNA